MKNSYDVIVVGAGAAGIMASIIAAKNSKKVLLLEKLPSVAQKLKATGGGRCNLTNSSNQEDFMGKFGRDGRFMQDALKIFNHKNLMKFFGEIGVETHIPDGFRVFPLSHDSQTIITSLYAEMQKNGVEILTSKKVEQVLHVDNKVQGVRADGVCFYTNSVIIATGGLGYPTLGAHGDGYKMAREIGHTVSTPHPAMMPLHTKERWVASCCADTIAKVELKINLKKHSRLRATGDLIFTKNGIRGPVVLDFAREVTPLLETHGEVPLLANLTKGLNENEIENRLKDEMQKNPNLPLIKLLETLIPYSVASEFLKLLTLEPDESFKKIRPESRQNLIKLLAWTPLTIVGHSGFKSAMITRGGVNLKEINPKTMQSKIIDGLYFCGEVVNLDGPCGGYNLQWAFSSGYLAGLSV